MTKVSFRVNLGSVDAGKIGVDFRACLAGETVEVDDAAAEWLAKSGLAVVLEVVKPPKPAPPPEPKAEMVTDVPADVVADPPSVETKLKTDPKKK